MPRFGRKAIVDGIKELIKDVQKQQKHEQQADRPGCDNLQMAEGSLRSALDWMQRKSV